MRYLALVGLFAVLAAAVMSDVALAEKPKKGKSAEASAATSGLVGKYGKFDKGQYARYAVWYEDGTWHLRATCPKGESAHFQAKIATKGGKLTDVRSVGLDTAKTAGKADFGLVAPNRASMALDMKSHGKVDGVSFKVSDATTEVTFTLYANGQEDPKQIYIGAGGTHPEKATFGLPANPEK